MPDRRLVTLAAAICSALLLLGTATGLAADKTVMVTGSGPGDYAWSPSTAEVTPSGTVEFKNTTATPHGLTWESGPETPSCPGAPSAGQGNWSGTCTFAQAGTYKFYCPVHPATMKGTITVNGPAAPVVATEPASSVTTTGATLNGKVNPSGQATTYFFEYGTTAGYGEETTPASAGEGSVSVAKSAAVGGLSPATTYHFRIVAENVSGTRTGGDRTLTTAGPPSATTAPATGVSDTAATLGGSVNPHGLSTTYFFNYGTTASYGQTTAVKAAGSGTANVAASAALSGLQPSTTYHFQLVATNSADEAEGADRSFTTAATPPPPPPPPPTPEPEPAPPAPPPAPPAPPLLPLEVAPPNTKITKRPAAKTRDRTPTIRFKATVAGATFQCSVDRKPFKPCRSPFTTPKLKPGRHRVRVRALKSGVADPSPAQVGVKVLGGRRHKRKVARAR